MSKAERKTRVLRAPRGTADVLPAEMPLVRRLEEAARRLFETYGYAEIRLPTFEHAELFERGIGEATDIGEKEMYTFGAEEGDRFALRPEGPAGVVRAYVEHGLDRTGGFTRFYYIGPMFRRERPQAGRMREFYQIGAEALGSADPAVDVELMDLAMGIFREAGLEGCVLKVNSIGCPRCRADFRNILLGLLAAKRDRLCEDCRRRMDRNVFRVLDCKQPTCREIASGLPPIRKHLDADCAAHFDRVLALLDAAGLEATLDDHLVRGFDYYTRTVWEISHPSLGARDAICGGGRYDDLVEQTGGRPTPASGFSIGEVPALLALRQQKVEGTASGPPRIFLVAIDPSCRAECFRTAAMLRRAGVAAELDYQSRSPKAQFRAANRSGAPYAGVIGPEELERGGVRVKEMRTGEERVVAREHLVDHLRGCGC